MPGASAYGELPTPEREDYTFGGWFLTETCDGTAVRGTSVVSSSHTLYAKWTENAAEEPEGPAIVAATAANLTEADATLKTSVGIDAAQTTYVYTKSASQSADLDNPASMYFSNENGYDYISFDIYFASFPAGLWEGKPYIAMKGYNNLVAAMLQ